MPVVASALASRAYGLEVMGGLATALMLSYATAEIADAFSQRHVPRLVGAGSPSAIRDRLAAYNAVRFAVLAVGLALSVIVLLLTVPDTPLWTFVVLIANVWATMASMHYALALSTDDYMTMGLGPVIALVSLGAIALTLQSVAPAWHVWSLAIALNVARALELAWVRRRQAWPGVSTDSRAVASEWNATRYLVAQVGLTAFHVRLVVPLVAFLAGTAAAGAFSIGLSLLAIVSMSAVAISVPAYRHANAGGPPANFAVAWARTKPDFFLGLIVSVSLALLLWLLMPWAVTTIFDVVDPAVHSIARLIVLSGLFEALALFAVLWYHACFRDRALLKLTTIAIVGGWVALVTGHALAGLPGIAWAFLATRAVTVLMIYPPLLGGGASSTIRASA